MLLIDQKRRGVAVPSQLPASVLDQMRAPIPSGSPVSSGSPPSAQPPKLVISPQERQKYNAIFKQRDPQNLGYLTLQQTEAYLSQSKLHSTYIKQILYVFLVFFSCFLCVIALFYVSFPCFSVFFVPFFSSDFLPQKTFRCDLLWPH